MSLRVRLALTIALITALTLGGAFGAIFWAYTGLQERQLDDTLAAVARSEAAEAPANGFRFSARPGPAANDVGPLAEFGLIYDEAGNVLAATEPFDRAPPTRAEIEHPLGTPFNLRFARQTLRAVMVPIPGHPGRVVIVAARRDDVDGDARALGRGMLLAIAIGVPWASFVAYWIGGRLTRDHAAIARVAAAVARGDLGARVSSRSPDPEVARLGDDIDQMVARLSELMTSQERFVANAAHELRSPLTALSGELQQALRKDRDAEGYRAAIGHALEATGRLRAVADDLLVIAGARHDAALELGSVTLAEVFRDARALIEKAVAERSVRFAIGGDVEAAVAHRNGDVTRLFRNLFENAVRHSPEGGTVRVDVARGERLRITVDDQGEGVEEADRSRVFEPFHRGSRSRRDRGTGLGLAIAREIARAHGGDVVLAEVGGARATGARFVVELPSW